MMFVSINSNTTGVTSGAKTAYTSEPREFTLVLSSVLIEQSTAYTSEPREFTPVLSSVLIEQSLVFCLVFCR
jgi:hypothetical protein